MSLFRRGDKVPDPRPKVRTVDDIVAWQQSEYWGEDWQPFHTGPALRILADEIIRLRALIEGRAA